MLKIGGCFSFSCWQIFILKEYTIPTDIHCIQELVEGGQVLFPLWLFVCFPLLDFPILPFIKGKNLGLVDPNPHSLNLLTEMVHPLEVFQIFFFQSGPTYHFCCMINTPTLLSVVPLWNFWVDLKMQCPLYEVPNWEFGVNLKPSIRTGPSSVNLTCTLTRMDLKTQY